MCKLDAKGKPLPEKYLNADYIQNHLKKFDEGAAFIFTLEDIANPLYKIFNPKKFVLLKSDMEKIITKYKATKNTDFLEDALGYKRGSLKNKEIFVYEIESPVVKIPSGNEGGVNELWIPGGKTSGSYNEAVLNDVIITHNNSIENLSNYTPFD
ncbi:MAG: hypothetical protein ABFS12_16710 [Bacteroidota bacterium]